MGARPAIPAKRNETPVRCPDFIYVHRNRIESARARANKERVEDIRRVHAGSRRRYGSPRVHASLRDARKAYSDERPKPPSVFPQPNSRTPRRPQLRPQSPIRTPPTRHRFPPIQVLRRQLESTQYAAHAYRRALDQHGMRCSVSRKGNCWDNAPMESFFGSLKTELEGDGPFNTRQAARTALFRAIEGWHNRERLHSSLGYMTPANKEQIAAAA